MNEKAKEFLLKNLSLWVIASLTLGLAPFFPHPHIWKQLVNISKGGGMMQMIDWLDLLMHGIPWILLITTLVLKLTVKKSEVKK